jgi:hypothetical protein
VPGRPPAGLPPERSRRLAVEPEGQTQDGLARAQANRERVRTDAALTAFEGLEAFEAAFTVEAVEARTLQRFDEDGALIVRSRSRVAGLESGGGVVRIDEVLAQSVVRMDGEAIQEIDATVRVSGVTVADQPAELSDDGIVTVGQGHDRQLLDDPDEYLAPDDPLAGMDNVVLTPHIGGATYDTEANHSRMIADDLERLLAGERPVNIANPEVL